MRTVETKEKKSIPDLAPHKLKLMYIERDFSEPLFCGKTTLITTESLRVRSRDTNNRKSVFN